MIRRIEVTDLPVRAGKFIPSKGWMVTGSDDNMLRVFNCNTGERIHAWEAHRDYIRSIAVHPTQLLILSCSDDFTIKSWVFEDDAWRLQQTFEGHGHYVMSVAFNPKDPSVFTSASMDQTIKVWNIKSAVCAYTLDGHERGANTVVFYPGADKPYIVSGGDDGLVKCTDYQTKATVATLSGHQDNVSAVAYHPQLPIMLSCSEDGRLLMYHSTTHRLEASIQCGMGRVWALATLPGSHMVVIGTDEGIATYKIGKSRVVSSMDSNGKTVWAHHNRIYLSNPAAAMDASIHSGDIVPAPQRELSTCELYPTSLTYSPNGRFVAACGDGEFIIYTSVAWRNQAYGKAEGFVWGDNNEYAIREGPSSIKVFRNFEERSKFRPAVSADQIFGGPLLSVTGRNQVCMYDWETNKLIASIDEEVKKVLWAPDGTHVMLACKDSFFILRYNGDLVRQVLAMNGQIPEEGILEAFEILHEINDRVRSATWESNCLIYINAQRKLNYCIGAHTQTIATLRRPMYILRYLSGANALFLMDKDRRIVAYTLLAAVLNFQTAVIRGEMERAERILPQIPAEHRDPVARFLDTMGYKEMALSIACDPDHRFELALGMQRLDIASEAAERIDNDEHWRQLGDAAITAGQFPLAARCLKMGHDLPTQLMLYSSTGDRAGMASLADQAHATGEHNVGFLALLLQRRVPECIDLLLETRRFSEAAMFARTYMPSQVSRVVAVWKSELAKINAKAAEALASPDEYPNLFPDINLAAKAETFCTERYQQEAPASAYPAESALLSRDLVAEMKDAPLLSLGSEDAASAAALPAGLAKLALSESTEEQSPDLLSTVQVAPSAPAEPAPAEAEAGVPAQEEGSPLIDMDDIMGLAPKESEGKDE
eukprot:gnl/Trimastix_PCT/1539.p1 GENE.gnl/Trimastix_PCT/1539~~gnl/Trimastix_PCT/1539.p1  ORF type:complete len:882 (+),score=353.69 gnl/Trimastix_PCT/1539:197-2842(+)